MKIPTGHLRLLVNPSNELPPTLQQWWIEISHMTDPDDVLEEISRGPLNMRRLGEWVDVPTVYGESE